MTSTSGRAYNLREGIQRERDRTPGAPATLEPGDPSAAERLLPLVYDELRKLAKAKMARENPGQTLKATGLVHEAYLRLVDHEKAQQRNSRGHFFGATAEAMRRILVENARRKLSRKAGGDRKQFSLEEADMAILIEPDRLLVVNEALDRLARTFTG